MIFNEQNHISGMVLDHSRCILSYSCPHYLHFSKLIKWNLDSRPYAQFFQSQIASYFFIWAPFFNYHRILNVCLHGHSCLCRSNPELAFKKYLEPRLYLLQEFRIKFVYVVAWLTKKGANEHFIYRLILYLCRILLNNQLSIYDCNLLHMSAAFHLYYGLASLYQLYHYILDIMTLL